MLAVLLNSRPLRLVVTLLASAGLGGCGLEACGSFGDFNPTPAPEAVVRGTFSDVSDAVRGRIGGELVARALSVDGAVLAEVPTRVGERFTLELGEGLDHVNVRVVVGTGSVLAKDFIGFAGQGDEIDLDTLHGPLGVDSTAAAQVVERYAVRERQSLASTPPGTLETVLDNARSDEGAAATFRGLVADMFESVEVNGDTPAFDPTSFGADGDALAAAGLDDAAYNAALEAAVDASLVPIVCDPSQLLVMFTVDASGSAKDGNGAPQFLRQPAKEGRVFLGITLDPASPVVDAAGTLRPRLTPNDPLTEMRDDGTGGDEAAGDQVFTTTLPLPRGMRVLYKYTNGSPNEGFTGTEEWPGNARILQVEDVLTSSASGQPDCLVIRRDSFGDESSNKNFVNLNARKGGADLSYDDDLGGAVAVPPEGEGLLLAAGLGVSDLLTQAPLTPQGIPEARENGTCVQCPAPLTVSADDDQPPRLLTASFTGTDQTRAVFSEDVDVQTAGNAANYLLVNDDNAPVRVTATRVTGSEVILTHDPVDPRAPHVLAVKDVKDASLEGNVLADNARVSVGPDATPPTVASVRASSIVEVNPTARPQNPETGEVVVVTFSEVLDRISAENAANYTVAGQGGQDGLEVYAAFQRGREVLLVTSQQQRGAGYTVSVGSAFDVAGNVVSRAPPTSFSGLSLALVTFQAVVDFAWLDVDGQTRGLPPGTDLYLTGTVLRDARAPDGGDLRQSGRTDVAGLAGFRFEPTDTLYEGQPVHALTLRLPPGTYASKLAYADDNDALNPPVTLESVAKGLSTRNDSGGVAVDPVTLQGKDGLNYGGARLSLSGQDAPGPGVIFKREVPDGLLVVGEADRVLLPEVVGTWRDVPFGRGVDYDDGLVELPLPVAGAVDDAPPRLLSARARDSESVLLSFDEAVLATGAAVLARVTADGVDLVVAEVIVGQPLPNQVVVRTGPMENDTAYSLAIGDLRDLAENALPGPVTAGFTSPANFQPFTPLVDDTPPAVVSVRPTSPTEIDVTFSERVTEASAVLANFALSREGGGGAPTVSAARIAAGGLRVVLTTTAQERQAPYRLAVSDVVDLAGNVLDAATVSFAGFGEFDPPTIEWARPLSTTRIAVKFNEPVTAESATRVNNYVVSEVAVTAVRFGASDEARSAAFNGSFAPLRSDVVLLSVGTMAAGGTYTVRAEGVQDLSGNESISEATFTAVAAPPTVDVVLSYLISDTAGVVGVGAGGAAGVPARALSPSTLSAQREGVFIKGTALSESGAQPVANHPFTTALGGFPAEGSPLDGVEVELLDNGQNGDAVAGDRVYSVRIQGVPLGSTLSWKAFASFTPAFGAANPEVPGAAFADAPRGPSVFADGQEYPGNDNAVLVAADENGDGVVRIENLFGDEITFKRKTGFPAFHIATDGTARSQ